MTLDYAFKTRLFWLVSRLNNCQYCLGHQEHKLHTAGMDDDAIAALDCDWSVFPPAEQAALEFTRRLTSFPHEFTDADIDALRSFFNDRQIVELVQTVAGYNSTNRWTDSLGIPQDNGFGDRPVELDTATSEKYQKRPSTVFPKSEKPRGEWEPREAVLAAFAAARNRQPRVTLLSDAAARDALQLSPDIPLPTWKRAQAYFPQSARRQGEHRHAVAEFGSLSPSTKTRIMWTVARENRAWYSAELARESCHKLGLTDEELFANFGQSTTIAVGDQAAVTFARKLTSKPRQITDVDIADLLKYFSATETAEVVYVICLCNSFDRFTEALGLSVEK
jgi:AhpD family alkylhydroperoxidase